MVVIYTSKLTTIHYNLRRSRSPLKKGTPRKPFPNSITGGLSSDSRRSSPENMAKDIEEGQTSQPIGNTATTSSSTTTVRVRAKPDPVLATCRCFSFVTVMASILCIIVNVMSAVRSFKNVSDIFDGIFRCYAVIIAVIVIVAETEWSFILKFWKVLEYWAGRGMLQIFVAVMTRAYPDIYGERHEVLLLRDIASYTLLACGLIYVLSGVLCLGFLKRARQNKEVSSQQAIKDLQDLERRRAELEALLIVDTP